MRFLLNSHVVESSAWEGSPALDFIRFEMGLLGTKEGCREGDCGACAVLVGDFVEGHPRYRAHPSCLMSLGELEGRHLVTIEALAGAADRQGLEAGLTPVMRALLEENGSQCGFCSPGFVVSLTAWLLEGDRIDEEGALRAIEGNLCRCTGYASIRRAARRLIEEFAGLPADPLARIEALAAAGVVPEALPRFARGEFGAELGSGDRGLPSGAGTVVGGGSDLYVRDPHPGAGAPPRYPRLDPTLRLVELRDGLLSVGGGVTVRDFFEAPATRAALPGIAAFEGSFASILVRNRATLAGNIVNASPVADLSALLLGLGARLRLAPAGGGGRLVAIEDFFLAYKKVDLREGEIVAELLVPAIAGNDRYNFEKLSKRESLDIAAVNTAIRLSLGPAGTGGTVGRRIERARVSAGGVAERPRLLGGTAAFLAGKTVDAGSAVGIALEAARIAAEEIAPIGDSRGSAAYRRAALSRLVIAHFPVLFAEFLPGLGTELATALGEAVLP